MRIFVSSSFEDLREHRAAVIRVLRQLGHEVLAMEDLSAASSTPLAKVLDMVDRSEAYVGLFAWRYGYVPEAVVAPTNPASDPNPSSLPGTNAPTPKVQNALPGETSITHYEYLRARERKLPIMAFLLDEQVAWPPALIDGFDTSLPKSPRDPAKIRALRQKLQEERVVAWFTTPSDLATQVSTAVTTAGLTSQLDLQTANALEEKIGRAEDSGAREGIMDAILAAARDNQCALKIDLETKWWSTRLFLLAALAERFTEVRRILIIDTSDRRRTPVPAQAAAAAAAGSGGVSAGAAAIGIAAQTTTVGAPPASSRVEEKFIGQIATGAVLSTLGPKRNEHLQFQNLLQIRPMTFDDLKAEINECLIQWEGMFAAVAEVNAKINITAELLRRWFSDTMLEQPLRIADLQRASVVDLLRLLDYPNDFVPVLTRHLPEKEGDPILERVDIMDKRALNRRLARSYLVELMDKARIGTSVQ